MKLLDLRFITDRSDWTVPVDKFVLVDVPDSEFDEFTAELEDAIASYMDSVFNPKNDTPWTKAVNDIMNACGRKWIPVNPDNVRVIRI